jgi:hypothetical protein
VIRGWEVDENGASVLEFYTPNAIEYFECSDDGVLMPGLECPVILPVFRQVLKNLHSGCKCSVVVTPREIRASGLPVDKAVEAQKLRRVLVFTDPE